LRQQRNKIHFSWRRGAEPAALYWGKTAVDNILRPKALILPESAQLPEQNVLRPPPNQFSHIIDGEQPYYFRGVDKGVRPAGYFSSGTRVLLLRHDSTECWVANCRGLYVAIPCNGMRPLEKFSDAH
jgi:hypothetical protein